MEQNDELLVDKKIAEAKLEVAEKRLHYFTIIAGSLLTIFGIGFPLLMTKMSSDEVREKAAEMKIEIDSARANFEKQLDKFAKEQGDARKAIDEKVDKTLKATQEESKRIIDEKSRSPRIVCLYKGKEVNSTTIRYKLIDGSGISIPFELYNMGTAVARNVRVILYVKDGADIGIDYGWERRGVSEEEGYSVSVESDRELTQIEAKIKVALPIIFHKEKSSSKTVFCIMKIFCGLPEPTEIKFNLEEE